MNTHVLRALALAALAPALAADTLYVDAGLTTGLDDGSSWDDAFQGSQGLQTALGLAAPGDEIWVARGTYLPSASGDRNASFALLSGVTLYGGFAGGEASPAERPPFGTADATLSGDLNGDDGGGLLSDNSYHVVRTVGTDATAVLDGFVVRGGEATTSGSNRDRGGGILCLGNVSPTMRHCRFVANRSSFGGAHGYVNNGGAPTFSDCSFEDGEGGAFGGAFDIAAGGPVLFQRCTFLRNTANRGGALEIFSTSGPLVDNCLFVDNVATGDGGGGAMWIGQGGNTRVRGCTVVSNDSHVNHVGGLRNQQAPNVTVANSIFWDNEGPGGVQNPGNQVNGATDVDFSLVMGGFGGGGVGNIDGDPLFVDPFNGDYALTEASPAVDAGDNGAIPAGTQLDHAGAPRTADVLAAADTGLGPAPIVDMGAFEVPSAWLQLGQGLAGSAGTPALVMTGTLAADSPLDVSLADSLGSAPAYLVIGLTLLEAPFKGGTLVPDADWVVPPLPTTPAGTLDFSVSWPAGVPSGIASWYQFWIADPGAVAGFSASNGLRGVTP